MANQDAGSQGYAAEVADWAKVGAQVFADGSRAILAFVPNGLNLIYDFGLKTLPVVGKFFTHRWVEQALKLASGVTIGQGIANDAAHFLFKPLGYVLGALIGAVTKRKPPRYQGQIGKVAYRLSGQTVGGALVGLGIWCLFEQLFSPQWAQPYDKFMIGAAVTGALIGLMAKAMIMIAINTVQAANSANIRKNVSRAKEINSKLKNAAKHRAKSRILRHAQDIIQQMNGSHSLKNLEEFFEQEYDTIALNTYKKIDRHFDYLADRACHGDVKALKRLQELSPTRIPAVEGQKNLFEIMLDRIFNTRAIFNLKDDVDTAYDRWQYSFLRIT